jgi:AcrR family transcriptional regulator
MDQKGESAGSGGGVGGQGLLSDAEASDVVQRQMIAEATCKIISRGGLEEATFRRIASELGATTGLISHYFASKADLLSYAINYAQERLAGQGLQTSWSTKEEFFDAFCGAITASEEVGGVFWRVWIAFLGVALADEDVRGEYLTWDNHYRRELLGLVRGELGESADADTEEFIADALNMLSTGIGIHAILDPEHLDPVRVRRILEHSFDGVIAAARASESAAKPSGRKRGSE